MSRSRPARAAAGRVCLVDLVVVLGLCGAFFLPFLGRYQFIKTEPLRALVVREMLERPGLTMPTLHHQPYLKKPPLYAWSCVLMARASGGMSEFVARLPSALGACLLVVILFLTAEIVIGRGAGLLAAGLALTNVTVLDYGVRAELDMPFAAMCTGSILLAWPALRRGGSGFDWRWLGVYALALAASVWKGPHALIFLWLALIAWSVSERDWRWIRRFDHGLGCVLAFGILGAWTIGLARFAGRGQVGEAAAAELFTRLVPYRPGDFLSILTFVPILLVITLPAAAFVIEEMRSRWPRGGVAVMGWRGRLQAWWRSSAGTPFERFLLCWLAGNVVFLAIAPAKSPRYSLPVFAPVFLLAASYIHARAATCTLRPGVALLAKVWRGVFGVVLLAAAVALVLAAGAALMPDRLPELLRGAGVAPFLACGVLWMAAGLNGLRFARRGQEKGVVIALVLIALGAQGPLWGVWWPLREVADTRAAEVAALEANLSVDEPVFVLGRKDFNAIAYYSPRDFHFLNDPRDAAALWAGPRAHFLLLEKEMADLLPNGGAGYQQVARFEKEGKPAVLLEGPNPAPADD